MRQNAAQRIGSGALVFFLVLSLLFSFLVTPAKAAATGEGATEATIEIIGEKDKGKFVLTSRDITFFALDSAAPGDTWEGTIKLKNKTDSRIKVCLYSIVNNLVGDDVLFNELDLKISLLDRTIYKGSYGSATEPPVTDFLPLKHNESLVLDVEVSLPLTAGNQLQGASMDSTWTFEARYDPPFSPGSGENLLKYYVHYLDEEGNALLETKVGMGTKGDEITEYAEVIEGYSPDEDVKNIILSKKNNEITFIYSKVEEPVVSPEAPQASQTPTKEDIQTGVNLTQSNSTLGTSIFTLLLTFLAVAVTIGRIQRTKKAIAKRDSVVKEAFKRDE